jgi:hypothetical protein
MLQQALEEVEGFGRAMWQLQELLIDEEAEATRRALDKAKKEKALKDRLDMIHHNQEQVRSALGASVTPRCGCVIASCLLRCRWQIRLKNEQRARDEAEERRLIGMMKKKFAEDEQKEREDAARRKREKEHVRM